MQELLQEFVDQKIGLPRNFDAQQIEICFIFLDKNVVCHSFSTGSLSNIPIKLPQGVDDDAGDEDGLDSAFGSLIKRKRLSMHTSSRKMPPPMQRPTSSGSHAPSSKPSHPVLRSAFQMPTQWMCTPVRQKHNRTWLFENWHLHEWTMPTLPTCIYLISYRTYSHVRYALDAMNML